MLKLKLQSFGHLIRRVDSLEKTLMLGKIEGRRMRWLDGTTDSGDMGLSRLQEVGKDREVWQSMGPQRVGHDLGMEQQRETPRRTRLCLMKMKLN